MHEEMMTLTAVISGRVQGVGYRQFVWDIARQYHLEGWVRNLPDRRVEVVLHGRQSVLAELLQHLRQGPYFAQVTDISEDWSARDDIPATFEIRK